MKGRPNPVRDRDDLTVTTVTQPLDQVGGLRLRNAIRKSVAEGKIDHALDLKGMARLDSLTLAAMIHALRAVREAGGSVSLLVQEPQILKILSITGLDRIFPIHNSELEARAFLVGAQRISA